MNAERTPVAPDADAVRAYFSRRAPGYRAASARWPWSALREREARAVLRLLGPLAGEEVLELGCGTGFYTARLLASGAGHVVAADIAREMVAGLPRERVSGLVGDAATVSFGRRFNRLLIAGLLEFVPDADTVLANARAHADTDAVLVVLAPEAGFWGRCYRAFHAGHGIRPRLFGAGELEDIAARAGWRLEETAHVPPFTLVARLRAAAGDP